MIKFDKNEFLKPQIYSTLNEYETRCNVTKEIIEEIEQLQQENKILKENAENNDKVVDKVNWENMLLKKENKKLNGAIQTYDILLKSNIEENQQLKIQISAREEEYKKLEDNWNYINKMLKEARQEKFNVIGYCGTCTDVDIDFLLSKMEELEGSDSNEI